MLAARVYENAVPTVAVAVEGLETTGAIPNVRATETPAPVPVALLALTETLKVPAPEGEPEMTPVVVLPTRPAGRFPMLKLVGLLEAETV